MSSYAVTVAAYVAVAAVAVVLEVVARMGWLHVDPLTSLVARLRAARSGRLALLVGWAWLTWHLLAR
jgi:hypothetical protein